VCVYERERERESERARARFVERDGEKEKGCVERVCIDVYADRMCAHVYAQSVCTNEYGVYKSVYTLEYISTNQYGVYKSVCTLEYITVYTNCVYAFIYSKYALVYKRGLHQYIYIHTV